MDQLSTLDLIGRVVGAIGGAAAIAYSVYALRRWPTEWRVIVPVLLFGANLCAFYVAGVFVSTISRDDYPTYVLLWWSRWIHLHALIIGYMLLKIVCAGNGNGKGEA